MGENKVQDYTDDKNEGHVDTREANFECEKKMRTWDVIRESM
jgi:hypothetical protein